ncbi:hypothetical protein DINM_006302 [Dirofilaria immitis]|nr:hypothetical protein [Dirofilaria immitis]
MVWVYWQGHCWWNRLIEIARDANSEEWIQSVQIKYELARKEIKNNPPKMLKAYLQNIIHRDIPDCDYFQMNEKKNDEITIVDKNSPYQTGDIIEKNDENTVLTEMLLYDIHYDHAWKSDYTKKFNKSKMKPLQELCDKRFFHEKRKVNLDDARSFILYQRPTRIPEFSKWLENDELNYRNSNLEEFFKKDWDGNEIIKRMNEFNWNVQNDLDQVRLQNQFYNNIVMWEALTGSRKQIFIRSMIGGMERRFEILDNQVNHIVFNHRAFDEHLDLCRNKRIKCRDSTRVVLKYPSDASNDFIHANYIQGGSLLINLSLHRRTGDQITYYGLTIINSGVNEFRLPLFRVTYLLVIGSTGDELYVEHWQGDMNNSDNVALPLQLLRLARNCSYPTIIHCHLGISRSATLHCVQKAVQLLRSQRPFCIETPMQYIFVHRIVQKFLHDYVGDPYGFHAEYKDWIETRAMRPFIDDIEQTIPGYRLLSPRFDPDLIGLVRHRERPNCRREIHDCVGQMPIPLQDTPEYRFEDLQLTKRYPRGNRYD